MITIHAKNAKASEGKARIDEMADLKQPKPSTSNKKIISGMGGLFAVIAYMKSFWSPDPAQAHAADENLREDADEVLQICEVPDISEWRAEMARAIPKDKPTNLDDPEGMVALAADRLFKVKDSGFFLQAMPVVNLPPLSGPGPATLSPLPPLGDGGGGGGGGGEPPPGPVAPVSPPGPTAPVNPVNPVDPVDPVDPVVPPGPVDPVPPVDPVDPVDPVVPAPPCDLHDAGDPDCGDAECGGTDPTVPAPVDDCDSCEDLPRHEEICADDTCADDTCAEDAALAVTRVVVTGSLLADALFGTDAAEEMLGLAGADRIEGMGGDDVIIGGLGDDDLAGGDGDDALMGGDDDDRLAGGADNDLLMGEAGDDVLDGGDGDDLLLGGIGADTLFGGDGDDRLVGEDGDDILHDGRGRDVLLGGLGDDTIHLLADAEVDFVDGGDGFDRLDLTAAQTRSHTDIALGEVRIDDGPVDLVVGIESFVAGTAADEFDFSGLATAKPDGDAPMFFQITDFGRGDTVRLTEGFSIGFEDVAEDRLWANTPDTVSELELRMREASGDTAEAVPSRLSFRTATEEGMVARVIDFDLDGDGQVDLALTIQGDQPQDTPQFPDQA